MKRRNHGTHEIHGKRTEVHSVFFPCIPCIPWFYQRFMTDMRTIFDDLFALLAPDRILRDPRATGEGVVVGVIDSGVDRAQLEAKFRGRDQAILPIEGGVFRPDWADVLAYGGRQSAA